MDFVPGKLVSATGDGKEMTVQSIIVEMLTNVPEGVNVLALANVNAKPVGKEEHVVEVTVSGLTAVYNVVKEQGVAGVILHSCAYRVKE